ncbi:hypothetical protein KSP40_PGU013830 [Platanthera guangdongensis]|uniref:Uncharacterized protein n=1 Tax=Platanthera guangdongensis TaxID=2320717 RepID=A0ABR2LTE4_9ASPA
MLGLLAFTCKIASRKNQLQQQRRRESMSNDSGSSEPTNSMHFNKFYMNEFVVSVLRKDFGTTCKRDLSLNIYLLKEAFEELERHPEIYEDPNLYDFACEFVLETVKRVAFMKIPRDRKVVWLKNRYNRNMFHGLVDEELLY